MHVIAGGGYSYHSALIRVTPRFQYDGSFLYADCSGKVKGKV